MYLLNYVKLKKKENEWLFHNKARIVCFSHLENPYTEWCCNPSLDVKLKTVVLFLKLKMKMQEGSAYIFLTGKNLLKPTIYFHLLSLFFTRVWGKLICVLVFYYNSKPFHFVVYDFGTYNGFFKGFCVITWLWVSQCGGLCPSGVYSLQPWLPKLNNIKKPVFMFVLKAIKAISENNPF